MIERRYHFFSAFRVANYINFSSITDVHYIPCNTYQLRGGLAEMEPGHRVSDFGRVGSRVSVSDPVFDPILSFNMHVYRVVLFLESNTISAS